MRKNKDKEPAFFKWIRTARAEFDRETEGMTPEDWAAYSRVKAKEAREKLPHFTSVEAERKIHEILYPTDKVKAKRKSTRAAKV